MSIQRAFGKMHEIGSNAFVGATQFLSKHKWIKTPDCQTQSLGEGSFRYTVNRTWCKAVSSELPVNNCHEMVVDSRGTLYLLTDHARNNVIVLDTSGVVVGHWTLNMSGAHGLTIAKSDGEEVLWICDPYSARVVQTTLNGRVLRELATPHSLGLYRRLMPYAPTQTAIGPNDDIYVADGYGSQNVLQFTAAGEFIRMFGGKREGQKDGLDFAHGIAIDDRQGADQEILLVTSRRQSCIKQFGLDGHYLGQIDLPGGYPCRPVIQGENLLVSLCWSGAHLRPNSGFVVILNSQNRVCATLGGVADFDAKGDLSQLRSSYSAFCHVHDVCADHAGNLYVCQWNAGRSYPVQLIYNAVN